jgi:hypothetical protein
VVVAVVVAGVGCHAEFQLRTGQEQSGLQRAGQSNQPLTEL